MGQMRGLEQPSMSQWQSILIARSPKRTIVLVFCLLSLSLLLRPLAVSRNLQYPLHRPHNAATSFPLHEPVEELPVSGFANIRIPDEAKCEQLLVSGSLNVTKSFYLDDDVLDIATSVAHPMITYGGQDKKLSFAAMVDKTWGRMAGSSAWLEKYGVYLTVTRVYFYDKGVRHWPCISFVRAQLFDVHWKHLNGYNLEWQGENITFPRTLEVPTPYEEGGGFYGPEDPRIIIEQGVEDAEPVIVFNMIEDTKTKVRSMHSFRPFSNFTTKYKIEHQDTKSAEKNWSPFFMPQANTTGEKRWPSHYIHFVYDYDPLSILRCHLSNGACSFIYQDPRPAAYLNQHKHNDTGGVMRGGTNFEPIHFDSRPGLASFVGFPRTHTDAGCDKEAIYRPEMMIMTTNGTHFYLDYSSEALTFGHALLTDTQLHDTCDKGRILLGNSIARFDDAPDRDIMTMSFTVADETVQIAKLQGVRRLIENLPQFNRSIWRESDMQWNLNVTHDVLICSIQSASDYALSNTKPDAVNEAEIRAAEERLRAMARNRQRIGDTG